MPRQTSSGVLSVSFIFSSLESDVLALSRVFFFLLFLTDHTAIRGRGSVCDCILLINWLSFRQWLLRNRDVVDCYDQLLPWETRSGFRMKMWFVLQLRLDGRTVSFTSDRAKRYLIATGSTVRMRWWFWMTKTILVKNLSLGASFYRTGRI